MTDTHSAEVETDPLPQARPALPAVLTVRAPGSHLTVIIDRLEQNALAVAIHYGDREAPPPRNPHYLDRNGPTPGSHLAGQIAADEITLTAITALLDGDTTPTNAPARLRALTPAALKLQRTLLERRLERNRASLARVQWQAPKTLHGPHLARLPGLRLECREGSIERGPRVLRLELSNQDWTDLTPWRLQAGGTPTVTRALYLLRGDGRLVAYANREHRRIFQQVRRRLKPAI